MTAIAVIVCIFIVASLMLLCIENAKGSMLRSRSTSARMYGEEERSDEQIKDAVQKDMRKTRKLVYGNLILATIIITVLNCFFITNEQQTAFTMTFGQPTMVEEPGMHFKLPFITKAYKEDATTKGMAIGYNQESNESMTEESLMITSDFNFVNTDFYLEYRITDPVAYVFGSNDPEGILMNVAQAAIRNTIGSYDVDSVITTGKGEIEAMVRSSIIEELQQHSTGLSIVNVTIQDAEPPTAEVSAAFKEVENAKQGADTAVNNAKQVENQQIPDAEAEADQILKAAEATKTEKINQAAQEVAEFNALYSEYSQNPDTVKKKLYYSVMEEILPNMEIIIGSDSNVIYVKNGTQVTSGAQ